MKKADDLLYTQLSVILFERIINNIITINAEKEMERVYNIAKNQDEAYQWDIKQVISMSPEERQEVALALKKRVYGNKPDIRMAE